MRGSAFPDHVHHNRRPEGDRRPQQDPRHRVGEPVRGQVGSRGAHDERDPKEFTIDSHTTKVMDNVKKLVEAGGGTVDSILQLTVYLTKLEDYEGMNKVFKTYFPHGGPARTTVAVAALPGNSLVEINCIAALPKK